MQLKKELGFIDVFCIACGAMISSGIFILPGVAFSLTGPSVFISYTIAGTIALIGVLSIAELSTAMPKAGGDYYFVVRSLGPLIGTIAGVLSWFALSLKSAFAIFGIAEVIYTAWGFNLQITAVLIALFFIFLNILGVRAVSKFEVFLVIGLLALMLTYFALGVGNISFSRYTPFAPEGFLAVFSTSGFVFVSFGGLINIASISEEVKNAKRVVPSALIVSVFFITMLYAMVLFVTVGTLRADALKGSLTPIAEAASSFLGKTGYILITVASLLSFITTAIAGILSASRYPLALSRDALFPGIVGRIHKRRNTPYVAILLTGALIVFSLFFRLELLVKAASTIILSTYVFSNIAVIVLRESGLQNYMPSFKAPLYPYTQILSVVLFVFLIADVGLDAVEIALGFLFLSAAIYFFYGRKRAGREYALLHVIERITNRKLTTDSLESELRDIIHERDEVVFDRFDHKVRESEVLDMKGPLEIEDFLRGVSASLEGKLKIEGKTLFKEILNRERESSTAITQFTAIPHIVIDGHGIFQVVLVRCREGVRFSDERKNVKAVFILIGTRDERHLHLQTLAAIAQIMQDESFEKRWIQAKSPAGLRDVILLSARKRVQ
jgi:APA family basic amino acid/polyamine antiporter